jgi:hypothetical protein
VYGLRSVREGIGVLYPNVEQLVANPKKFFVKSTRTELFKNKAPDAPTDYTLGSLVGRHYVLRRQL